MKSKKKQQTTNLYSFDNFQSHRDIPNVTGIDWGNTNHVRTKKIVVKNKDLIINNRFDFGGDNDILIRNTSEREFKRPNIFHLLKKNIDDKK